MLDIGLIIEKVSLHEIFFQTFISFELTSASFTTKEK